MLILTGIVAIGVLIGTVLGLTGAGGSLFAVPLLTLLMGLPLQQSTGIALGAVAMSAWVGVWGRWQRKEIAWGPGVVLTVSASITVPLGRWTTLWINENWLFWLFCLLVMWVALRMWQQAQTAPEKSKFIRAASDREGEVPTPICLQYPDRPWHMTTPCMLMACLGGVITGWLSGVFGVGGGFVIVPILVLLARLDMRFAVATSLLVIACVSSVGFVSHWLLVPDSSFVDVIPVGLGGILGMLLGSRLGRRIAGPTLQKMFALGLVLLTLAMMPSYL